MQKNKDFNELLKKYGEQYSLEEDFITPNDKANLESLINNQIALANLQERFNNVTTQINDPDTTNDTAMDLAAQLKRMSDTIKDIGATVLALERQLGIDKKTREEEKEQSVVDYIQWLKKTSKVFLDDEERLTKVYCKACNIMVGRISGVYDTTHYKGTFQCPQCNKKITITRKARDIFFDLEEDDKDWRRKYPMEVIQPQLADSDIIEELPPGVDETDGELYIGDT